MVFFLLLGWVAGVGGANTEKLWEFSKQTIPPFPFSVDVIAEAVGRKFFLSLSGWMWGGWGD